MRYLADQARAGHVPKEIEIADAVFTRSASMGEPDASVRVYLHRLRRKLEEYYSGPGRDQETRIVLPKGTYRLTLMARPSEEDSSEDDLENGDAKRRSRRRLAIAATALLVAFGVGWFGHTIRDAQVPIAKVRRSALWRPLLENGRNIEIVVGDYYIFGENDDMGDVVRLVRDFDVQSPEDLEKLRSGDPGDASRYTNLDLSYLAVGTADALRSIVPVVTTQEKRDPQLLTVPSSQLNPHIVSDNNIVYVGYISGMRDLRYPVFSKSRFAVGASYDEIIDRKTGNHYIADSHLAAINRPGEDYAIVSGIKGPTGNRILVIAGTRDAALMQAARLVSDPDMVHAFDAVAGQGSFEALISIDALDNVGLSARLIAIAPRADPSWSKPVKLQFPDTMP